MFVKFAVMYMTKQQKARHGKNSPKIMNAPSAA